MNVPIFYQANPVVSCGVEADGAVLYNPDADATTVINTSGRRLWEFLAQPCTVDELAAQLVVTYQGVSLDQATRDATVFVETLAPDFVLRVDDVA